LAGVLLLFVVLLYCLTLNPYWRVGWDSAIYISLAKSLAAGQGYAYMGFGHTKYPPLFPLLLSAVIETCGTSFLAMRLTVLAFTVASVGIVYLLFRESGERWLGLATAALSGVSFAVLDKVRFVQSDLPFLFFVLLALYFLQKRSRFSSWHTLGLHLSLAAAFYTRTAGLALFVAAIAFYGFAALRRRERSELVKAVAVLFTTVVCVGAWSARNATVANLIPPDLKEGETYAGEFLRPTSGAPEIRPLEPATWLRRLWHGAVNYSAICLALLTGEQAQPAAPLYGLLALVLVGLIAALAPGPGPVEFYFLSYGVLLLLWPATPGHRFLLPIVPMFFYYLLSGGRTVLRLLARVAGREGSDKLAGMALAVAVMALLAANATLDARIIAQERALPYYSGETADFISGIRWLAANVPADAVVISDPSPPVYLLSGRRSVLPIPSDDPRQVLAAIEKHGSYLLYAPVAGGPRSLLPILRSFPDRFDEIYRQGSCVVYRVRPDERPQ